MRNALSLCLVIRQAAPAGFGRAARRWVARFATERATSLEDVAVAVAAFELVPRRPDEAVAILRRLCG